MTSPLPIVQLVKKLTKRPQSIEIANLCIRPYRDAADIDPWLALRNLIFKRDFVSLPIWNGTDFDREFLAKPWWQSERMLIAEWCDGDSNKEFVGAVTLGEREIHSRDSQEIRKLPTVHWLMVHPSFRRRGIARALIAQLELTCWNNNQKEIHLETHRDWRAAEKLYESLGYKV